MCRFTAYRSAELCGTLKSDNKLHVCEKPVWTDLLHNITDAIGYMPWSKLQTKDLS